MTTETKNATLTVADIPRDLETLTKTYSSYKFRIAGQAIEAETGVKVYPGQAFMSMSAGQRAEMLLAALTALDNAKAKTKTIVRKPAVAAPAAPATQEVQEEEAEEAEEPVSEEPPQVVPRTRAPRTRRAVAAEPTQEVTAVTFDISPIMAKLTELTELHQQVGALQQQLAQLGQEMADMKNSQNFVLGTVVMIGQSGVLADAPLAEIAGDIFETSSLVLETIKNG